MQILGHRGYWKKQAEKNTREAFDRSFASGFGIETDIRDCCGELVVSHDPPGSSAMPLAELLKLHQQYGGALPLALNIKADGLQKMLMAHFEAASLLACSFFFDMSVPDTLGYQRAGLPYFIRLSEYETVSPLLDTAIGVWLDAFESDWYDKALLMSLADQGKKICIVSPELHGREYRPVWDLLFRLQADIPPDILMLCTDYPEQAAGLFGKEMV